MANAATPVIPRDGSLALNDATTPSALTLTVPYTAGGLKLSELVAGQRDYELFYSRGDLFAARGAQGRPIAFEFSAYLVGIIGDGTTALLLEALLKKGMWASAVSTLPTTAGGYDAYCLTMVWSIERTNFGGGGDDSVTIKYALIQSVDLDEETGQITVRGVGLPYSTDYASFA